MVACRMGKKSRKRRRRNKLRPAHKYNPDPSSATNKAHRMNFGMALPILGIMLGTLGLMGLRPQISVSLGEALNLSTPFTRPFKLTNSGLLSLSKVHASIYADKIIIGNLHIGESILETRGWTAGTLESGEIQTLIPGVLSSPVQPSVVDIAVIVQYSAWYIPFFRGLRIWRFVGITDPSGEFHLVQQPSEPIKKRALGVLKSL